MISFPLLVRDFYLLAEPLYLTSVSDKVLHVDENIINKEDAKKIWNYALAVIESELINILI